MKKLMSTIAIIGMLFTGSMSESIAETTVAPETCGHNEEVYYDNSLTHYVFDDENTDAYLDEFYMDLYMDYYTYTNHCEECDWDYYEYCECDYGQRFDDEYYEERAQNLCDDYLAFVNDYVDYESNCTEYCENCDKYYYDHCCDEYCDFNVYYMDLQYLEMIQEESTEL